MLFWVSRPDFVQPQPIEAEEINAQFIEQIEQNGNNRPSFYIKTFEKYKAIFSSATYKEAKLWLLEDEYERFEQRFNAEKVA
ncbi:hypothetical protein PN462_21680 [Spirulina sp. CS-785/01]|nr:hypothetical protein [Spirulina sp. CS-785/01]MDB9315740.1 hypothetical protein [Spirulina sp. CS-785/01]